MILRSAAAAWHECGFAFKNLLTRNLKFDALLIRSEAEFIYVTEDLRRLFNQTF